jgi:hypothetical protein
MERRLLIFGVGLGVAFGVVDLIGTWAAPLADDSGSALLLFYGPMFFVWALASYLAARRTRSLLAGIVTGCVLAFATFSAFYVMNMVRVNTFLTELTARDDWQNMMRKFHGSGFESLRLFINWDYLKGAPFKIGVASFIGAVMGAVGGTVGHLMEKRPVLSKG